MALFAVAAVAAGRVADPPNYRQLLRKIASSPDMWRYMRDDLGRMPAELNNDLDKTTVRVVTGRLWRCLRDLWESSVN